MMHMAINRRTALAGLAGAAAVAAVPARAAVSGTARELYDRAIIVEGQGGPGGYDPAEPDATQLTKRNLADVRDAAITVISLTVGQVGNVPDSFERAVAGFADAIALAGDSHPDLFMIARRKADIAAAKASKRTALALGFQDSAPFGADLDRVDMFHDLGLRICQPTYNRRNLMGDGCLEPANGGLSKLGLELVAKLNEKRILVDASHAGPKTQTDAIAACKGPMAITHTACRALTDHPRNTHDATLKALADKGGVAGIYFMPYLLTAGQPHAEDLIRHIEHAVNVMGEDHVGLGTDGGITGLTLDARFKKQHADQIAARKKAGIGAPGETADVYLYVPEYNTPRRFETLADDLLKRGWSTTRVEKLLGANFARLFGDVWG
jgi:membrane dipeptidase